MNGSQSQARLEVVVNSQTVEVKLQPGSVCQIGRDAQSAIVLPGGQVSRRHAMVQGTDSGEYYLIDIGSRNGTFVNQRRVTAPVVLHSGDRIGVGEFVLLFRSAAETAEPKPAPQRETVVDLDRHLITVLVTDIRDFTGLSTRLGEAKLSQVISAFNRESGLLLNAHGAWAQKYIGDAVMAFWLHANDLPGADDLCNVFASLEKMFALAANLQPQFGLDAPVRIGAGINTGLAYIGNMGSDATSDYTALSDAVILAFRLESATKEIGCDIALGRKTHELIRALASVGDLFHEHTVTLKGYREPKPVFAAAQPDLNTLLERLRKSPAPTVGISA